MNINNEKNNRFIYEKDDIEIKSSQCDFCKYNNSNEKMSVLNIQMVNLKK